MSKHLQRSWAVILQQAWNLRLKDKIEFDNSTNPDQNPKKSAKDSTGENAIWELVASMTIDVWVVENLGMVNTYAEIKSQKGEIILIPLRSREYPVGKQLLNRIVTV